MAKTPASDAPIEPTVGGGKNRPTPSRAEQEAARKRPLVPDTKEAKAKAKHELNLARERARIGQANGEEKYLMARDRGPQRRFARDYADSGWHLGEFIMPAMFVVIIIVFFNNAVVAYGAFVVLLIMVLFVIGDMIITTINVKRAARIKFGADRLERGLGWYTAMRTIQMRFLRLPKPQVKRGTRVS